MIVDATVAMKWFLHEPMRERARTLIAREDLKAPDIIVPEILNGLRKAVRDLRLDAADAREAITQIELAIPSIAPSILFADDALRMSLTLAHHINDCLYLAQAEAMDAHLITADLAFVDLVTRKEPKLAKRLLALEHLT